MDLKPKDPSHIRYNNRWRFYIPSRSNRRRSGRDWSQLQKKIEMGKIIKTLS